MVNSTMGTGQGPCNTVCKVISDFGLDVKKCIGSSADGTSIMRGEYNGFNAWLSKEAPKHVHIWCYVHILNLIMTNTTKVCVERSICLEYLIHVQYSCVSQTYVWLNGKKKVNFDSFQLLEKRDGGQKINV